MYQLHQIQRQAFQTVKVFVIFFPSTQFMYIWASLMAQTVKNLSAMQETWV